MTPSSIKSSNPRLVVLQPSYIPWIGYFAQIAKADIFVFLDDVQYTKGDWRNRNRVLSPKGSSQYLTVPVHFQNHHQAIYEIKIDHKHCWAKKHLRTLKLFYQHTPYFKEIYEILACELLKKPPLLSDLNISLTRAFSSFLGLSHCTFVRSSELPNFSTKKSQRLVDMCKYFNARYYLTGLKAKGYLDEVLFMNNRIHLEYQSTDHPVYKQGEFNFKSHLSLIDLLFRYGIESQKLLYSWELKLTTNPLTFD